MPVREKAVTTLLDGLIGSQWFQSGICQSMPDKAYRGASELADAIYVRLVDRIDWNRVLLEAWSRHVALEHDDDVTNLSFGTEGVCGECVVEALLSEDFGGRSGWKENPYAERDPHGHGLLPPGVGRLERPSDDAANAVIALAKALNFTGKSYEDEE